MSGLFQVLSSKWDSWNLTPGTSREKVLSDLVWMIDVKFLDAEFVSERYGEVHFRPIKMRYVFQIMILEPPWFQLESYDYIMLGE